MKKLFGLVMVFMFAAVMSHATETLTAQGTAKAKIIQAATFVHASGAALDFGTIIPGANEGTVTLSAVATPTPVDNQIGGRTSDPVSSDHFVLGNLDTGVTYHVSVPASVTITNANSDTMSVALTGSDTDVTGVTSKDIYVGGVLTVGASQAVGEYEGNYTVTVTY